MAESELANSASDFLIDVRSSTMTGAGRVAGCVVGDVSGAAEADNAKVRTTANAQKMPRKSRAQSKRTAMFEDRPWL
jgi:hypothetical protein